MQGAVEAVRDGWVSGWAFDPADPTPLGIRVELAGRLVATGEAALPRADILTAFGREQAGFRLHAAALQGVPVAQVLAALRVVATTPAGPREVSMWSRLVARLEEEARAEAMAVLLAQLQGPEAREALRERLAAAAPEQAAAELGPLLDQAPGAAATPEGVLCRAILAMAAGRVAACRALLTRTVAEALDAASPHMAALAAGLRLKAAYAEGDVVQAAGLLDEAARRGWPVEPTLAAAIRQRLAEAAEPPPALALPPGLTLVLTGAVAGPPVAPMRSLAVGLGLEDAPDDLAGVLAALEQVPAGRRHLVAAVGGMGFLRLIGRLRFARITLFDPNLAELVAAAHARAEILATPHGAFDGFRALDGRLRRGFRDLYLPGALRDIRIARRDFHAVADGRVAPAETRLSPLDHPGRAWAPGAAEYALARENLASAFDHELHLAPPPLAPGMFGIVWLGGLEIGTAALLEALGSPHVAVLRAGGGNAAALEARLHREWRARDLAGNHRLLWLGAEAPAGHAVTWEALRAEPAVAEGACLVLDRLDGAAGAPALEEALALAARPCGRIVVVEEPGRAAAAAALARRVLRPEFEFMEEAFAPGPGSPRAQVLLAFQRAGEVPPEPED